jgi:hypothetical protein
LIDNPDQAVPLRTLGLVLLFFLASQLLFLWRPSVNLEYAFVEAARSLAGQQAMERIEYYWVNQANPLGYSMVASLLLRMLPMVEPIAIVRLISVVGGLLVLVSTADLLRYMPVSSRRMGLWSLLLVAFNPMIWLYANNATADVFPAGLVMASYACCLHGRGNWRWHVPGVLLFSLSCIVKFNCALMSLGLVYILLIAAWDQREKRVGHLLWLIAYAVCSIGTLASYFLWIHRQFGIVFLPEQYKSVHTFNTLWQQRLLALGLYLDFLMLFTGPLMLILLNDFLSGSHVKISGRHLGVLVVIMMVASSVFYKLPSLGEMDVGGLLRPVGKPVLSLIQAIGFCFVLLLAYSLFKGFKDKASSYIGFLLGATFPYLLISAMSRPAQRYLILILPMYLIWLIYLVMQSRLLCNRILLWGTLGIFLMLTTIGISYLNAQAYAAQKLGQWVESHQLSDQTDPGILNAHIGMLFPLHREGAPTYRLIARSHASDPSDAMTIRVIHSEPVMLGPVTIRYFQLVQDMKTEDIRFQVDR